MNNKMNLTDAFFATDFEDYHRYICVNRCNLWQIFPDKIYHRSWRKPMFLCSEKINTSMYIANITI